MAAQTPIDTIKRYLEDAIAAEQHFETHLTAAAQEANQLEVKQLFTQHAAETRTQHQRLTARLAELGGSPSGVKSFMANLFGFAPKLAQVGHERAERSTQDLIVAFSVENSEIAMYESLANAADQAGDPQTAALAREIQAEEQATAQKVFALIGPSARDSYTRVITGTA